MGVLPFLQTAQLQEIGGANVTAIPCSIWPTSGGDNVEAGRAYDHEGEAPIAHLAALSVVNRHLLLDGVKYRVISAIGHPFLPHVSLRLREMRASGGG